MTILPYETPSLARPAERRWTRWLTLLGPLMGLVFVYGLFALIGPASFSTSANLVTMARQTVIVGTAALGMTVIIISAGIDLSVGSMIALTTVVVAALLRDGAPPAVAALAGIGAATLCGLANGVLVASLRVGPFIVTLGMLLVLRGLARGAAGNAKIDAPPGWLAELMAVLPPERAWMVLPPGVWVMLGLAAGVAGVLRYTRLGRHAYAVGSNEQTARLCGVPVARVKVSVYALGGLLTGVAGLMQYSRLSVGDPTVATGLELDVIAAVVIGGGSLAGGEGSVLGTLAGAMIMTVIRAGCDQMDVEDWVQQIITGAIIICAVTLDRLRSRRAG